MTTGRILAVDDEPHMLLLLERIVTDKTPYSITTTSNSLELPMLLDKGDYDIIISDLKMPGLDGMDILRLLKERNRDEQAIIITAFGTLETAMESLSLGVSGYILKPFKKEQIIASIERTMEVRRMKRELKKFCQIIETEPYEDAERLFRKLYNEQLAARTV